VRTVREKDIQARLGTLNRGEILHYLGYDGQTLDSALEEQIDRCRALVTEAAVPRLIWKRTEVEHAEVLPGCSLEIMMAATIGAGVDQMILRYEVRDMGDAVIMDACASAAIENVCDNAEHDLREMLREEGLFLTDRYSPGYGDFPLASQVELCQKLDSARKIGVMLTESGLMIPRKSVTAILGISERPVILRKRGCEFCSLGADCPYRRNGKRCEAAEE
jgi:hypothetical protein